MSKRDSDKATLEEGTVLLPRYDARGLITAVVTDCHTNELLMVAHMNEQALFLSINTGIAHYWSRSRQTLWKKGESSGNLQVIKEMRVDCDQDTIWLKVEVQGHGATCHTGRSSCFYRKVIKKGNAAELLIDAEKPLFDPKAIYSDK